MSFWMKFRNIGKHKPTASLLNGSCQAAMKEEPCGSLTGLPRRCENESREISLRTEPGRPEGGALPQVRLGAVCRPGRKEEDNSYLAKGGPSSQRNFISCFLRRGKISLRPSNDALTTVHSQ